MRIAVSIVFGIMLIAPSTHGGEVDAKVAKDTHIIEQVLADNRDAIMALPNVVGTGLSLCEGELCIKVLVSHESPELRQQLDGILGQHLYVLEQTDPVHTLPAEDPC